MDIEKYKLNQVIEKQLEVKNGSIITKNKLFVVIPMRYEKLNYLNITNIVSTLGVVLVLDEKGNGQILLLPNIIQIQSSEIAYQGVNNKDYMIATVNANDSLLLNDEVIVSTDCVGTLFKEFFILNNNIPYFIRQRDILSLFLKDVETGGKLAEYPVELSVLLSIISKQKDGSDWRFDRDAEMDFIGLSDKMALSASASLVSGGYIREGLKKLATENNLDVSDLEMLYQ